MAKDYDKDDWSPSSLVSQALKSDLDPGVFSVIDESDIRKCSNFVDLNPVSASFLILLVPPSVLCLTN
ncbi:hypothetical protein LCGC14_2936990 [marine sediment metagenome]|uniref:Uncharacterized protein n=1 Tax=marine sediment metagenome TaxID=412755 RepID=A0A0F9AA59_9ZZZZ